MNTFSRRGFLIAGSCGVVAGASGAASHASAAGATRQSHEADPEVGGSFPRTPTSRAEEFVGACHVRLDRVREMLAEDAGLAKASWDWGFGDWENAIGASSHTGRTEIIELLIAHGARPTLFTLAALDRVDAVRDAIEHIPGAADLEGPHSISLYDHARAGRAERVMEYLLSRGPVPADPFATDRSASERYFGDYVWGEGKMERFTVEWFERRSAVSLRPAGQTSRNLIPLGEHRFSPAGARHVVIRFEGEAERAERLVVPWMGGEIVAERV